MTTQEQAGEDPFASFSITNKERVSTMASFHHRIKSGKKGTAEAHVEYIAREGKHALRHDLMASGVGNMPGWAEQRPMLFWHLADRYERKNGAAYKEHEVALPSELLLAQQVELVERLLPILVGDKPHQWAIHMPKSSLEGVANAHVHIMYSDRMDDGIPRAPEQGFKRYNPTEPSKGGFRKDSGGMSPLEIRMKMKALRKQGADIQNEVLEKYGHSARVDHRSLRDRGIEQKPETHLGQARIRRMSESEKKAYLDERNKRRG
ncbi:hypothetical protein HDE78_002999 [Rhodanobacter sp. K2T2]|nr:hypothetical protein [Rhodanobacter sp. K2T2]